MAVRILCFGVGRRWAEFRAHALLLFFAVSAAPAAEPWPGEISPAALRSSYDIVVAGAGTGGCGAAIQAARLGATVLLLEETEWIGGQMLAAAVTAMDEGGAGNLVRTRGLYREYVERIQQAYAPLRLDPFVVGRYVNTRVEPRVGRRLLHELLAEAPRAGGRLDLALRARVTKVARTGNAVTGVTLEWVTPAGVVTRSVASRVLIDATEWGDVLPLTGARYRAGNRTSDALDRAKHLQENTWTAVIRRYPGGAPEALRIRRAPPGYAARHAVFAKAIVPGNAPQRRGEPMSWAAFVDYRGMPDSARADATGPTSRTHLNFTNDYPCTVAYLEDPAQRTAVNRAMRLRTLQLLHYVQNILGMSEWSVADDEGFDTASNRAEIAAWLKVEPELEPYRAILEHFSVIPYVRESRRVVGLHTLLAREISRGPGRAPRPFASTIALGDYRLDLHGGRGAADLELDLDRREDLEDAQPGRAGPFAIPCEVLIPETVDGLLAAEKNVSQTRLVNGATRMQPHTLNVGQAAGALAALAVRHGVPPRKIEPVLVQQVLLAGRATLQLTPLADVDPAAPDWAAIQIVTVHGLLGLEQGRFAPTRPLARSEFAGIVKALAGRPDELGLAAADVTRAEFARVLSGADPAVTIRFESSADAARQPITRSEAAQISADFMTGRALGRLRGSPEVVPWSGVRAAGPAVMAPPPAGALRWAQRLVAARVIEQSDCWTSHAVAGKECDGEKVAEVLLAGARLIDPMATSASALTVLTRARVISAPEVWARTAVPGGRCAGKNVASLLRNLGENESVGQAAAAAGSR